MVLAGEGAILCIIESPAREYQLGSRLSLIDLRLTESMIMHVDSWDIISAPYEHYVHHRYPHQQTEHANHGEIVAEIPFLTPDSPQDQAESHEEYDESGEDMKNVERL